MRKILENTFEEIISDIFFSWLLNEIFFMLQFDFLIVIFNFYIFYINHISMYTKQFLLIKYSEITKHFKNYFI